MHETIAECALVWLNTQDAELTRQAHEKYCVPLERSWQVYVRQVIQEAADRLDAEAAAVLARDA